MAGMVVFPTFVIFELIGPAVEMAGLLWFSIGLAFGFVNTQFALLYFVAAFILSGIVSVMALAADRWSFSIFDNIHSVKLLTAACLEAFGYRQLTMMYRIRGFYKLYRGDQTWGRMLRRGGPKQVAKK